MAEDKFHNRVKQSLFSQSAVNASGQLDATAFKQYEFLISSIEKNSDRRQQANSFFLTMTSGLAAILGYLLSKDAAPECRYFLWVMPLAGVFVSIFWYRLILSYRQLNTGKFEILHSIEEHLPLALYKAEWTALGEGKDPKKYRPFTHIEQWIPLCFLVLFTLLALRFAPWTCGCGGLTGTTLWREPAMDVFWTAVAAIATVVMTVILWRQTSIFKKQTDIFDKQTAVFAHQNKLDLFDKRYEVYRQMMFARSEVMLRGGNIVSISKEEIPLILHCVNQAPYLFEKDVSDFVKEFYNKFFTELPSITSKMSTADSMGPEYADLAERKTKVLEWFREQSEEKVQGIFMPYLDFRKFSG